MAAAARNSVTEPASATEYRRATRRRLAFADTVILAVAVVGVCAIVWQLSTGGENVNLNDGLVALVSSALAAAVTNARSSREFYFGSSAKDEDQ